VLPAVKKCDVLNRYRRMKKISGTTITGKPLAIAPRAHHHSSPLFLSSSASYSHPSPPPPITFYSNPICPFAHRVWLSLLETQTPHEFKHVPLDPSGKGREWYTPIYRAALGADQVRFPSRPQPASGFIPAPQDPDSFGAVPVLRDGDFLMAESAPIARYVFAKSAMRPSPQEDARISIFMEQVAGNIIGPW
jgi:hypothetical protein